MITQVGSCTELPDWGMLRKYIYQLKGVMHVQIVPDDQGIVLEVHVIADRSRSAKQIASMLPQSGPEGRCAPRPKMTLVGVYCSKFCV